MLGDSMDILLPFTDSAVSLASGFAEQDSALGGLSNYHKIT